MVLTMTFHAVHLVTIHPVQLYPSSLVEVDKALAVLYKRCSKSYDECVKRRWLTPIQQPSNKSYKSKQAELAAAVHNGFRNSCESIHSIPTDEEVYDALDQIIFYRVPFALKIAQYYKDSCCLDSDSENENDTDTDDNDDEEYDDDDDNEARNPSE